MAKVTATITFTYEAPEGQYLEEHLSFWRLVTNGIDRALREDPEHKLVHLIKPVIKDGEDIRPVQGVLSVNGAEEDFL